MPGWKRKGWKKSDGKPVLNLDLLKEIDAAIAGRNYEFEWVKGHAGHELNEAADDRARDAATAYQAKRAPNAGPGFPGSVLVTEVAEPAAKHAAAKPATATGSASQNSSAAGLSAAAAPVKTVLLLDELEQPDLFSLLDDDADPAFANHRDAALETVVELERELLDPAVRADPLRVGELLHPHFEEIGVSGRRWSRAEILEMFSDEEAVARELQVLSLAQLDAETALLSYRSVSSGGSALRSSIWQRQDGQWRLRHHQGTTEA